MSCIKEGVLVLYAKIVQSDISAPLIPDSRDREVRACKSERARLEKYLVWKLLERAVREHTTLDFANLQFAKTENGQWICPDFHFSLSHTDGVVCVALSSHPVGVDIEKIRPMRAEMIPRFLTEREREYMLSLSEDKRERFFFECWVAKESIFKRGAGRALMPRDIETLDTDRTVIPIRLDCDDYLIAIATENNEKCEIRFMEEI